MNLSKKSPIHWVNGRPAKVNPMKLKRKAISPSGNVVEMSLANGKATRSMMGNTYAQIIQHEKERKDWVWYAECAECPPVVRSDVPGTEPDLSAHCKDCCAREALIGARMASKRASNEDYSKLFETRLDKLSKAIEQSMIGNQRPKISDEKLAEVMTAEPPAPKKRKVSTK